MGLKSTLFGHPSKGSSSSVSGNSAYPAISSAFTPALGYLTQGGSMMGNLLGLNGGQAQTQGLQNWANSGGYNFLMNQGIDTVNSNMYSRGLGASGADMKALENYRSGLASTYLNQYMNNLLDFSKLGLGAGGVMSDAGRFNNSTSSEVGAKKGILGDIVKAAASFIPK